MNEKNVNKNVQKNARNVFGTKYPIKRLVVPNTHTHKHINTQNTKHKKDRNLPLFQPQFLHPFRRVHPREQDEKHWGGGTGLLESLVHVERGLFHKNRAQLHRDEMLNLTRQAILPHGTQQPVEIEKELVFMSNMKIELTVLVSLRGIQACSCISFDRDFKLHHVTSRYITRSTVLHV